MACSDSALVCFPTLLSDFFLICPKSNILGQSSCVLKKKKQKPDCNKLCKVYQFRTGRTVDFTGLIQKPAFE